jgi:predicted amidohydrolase YtcJ
MWFRADDPAAPGIDAALGPERARRLYPIATLARADARIVASSDWPATSLKPLDAIEAAVTRQPLGGTKPARQPDQRMALAAMLAAYTRDAAYVAREDDGVLAPGKPADLIVLDRNLFKLAPRDIHKARVLLTLLDGEPVWRAKGWR